MISFGSFFLMNILPLMYATVLSWYVAGSRSHIYPDKVIGSIISYTEKSLLRKGTATEGAISLLICILATFAISFGIIFYASQAGYFWYFAISTAFIFFSMEKNFTIHTESGSTLVTFLSYALPIMVISALFSPAGAVAYRVLPLMTRMLPTENDRFAEFGKPAEKVYKTIRDINSIFVPIFPAVGKVFDKSMRFIKSFRP